MKVPCFKNKHWCGETPKNVCRHSACRWLAASIVGHVAAFVAAYWIVTSPNLQLAPELGAMFVRVPVGVLGAAATLIVTVGLAFSVRDGVQSWGSARELWRLLLLPELYLWSWVCHGEFKLNYIVVEPRYLE